MWLWPFCHKLRRETSSECDTYFCHVIQNPSKNDKIMDWIWSLRGREDGIANWWKNRWSCKSYVPSSFFWKSCWTCAAIGSKSVSRNEMFQLQYQGTYGTTLQGSKVINVDNGKYAVWVVVKQWQYFGKCVGGKQAEVLIGLRETHLK